MGFLYNFDVELLHTIQPAMSASPILIQLGCFCAQALIFFIPIHLALLWFYGNKSGRKDALTAFFLILLGLAISFLIGHTIYRMRPYLTGVAHAFIKHRDSASFPSDHALIFAIYLYCLFYYRYRFAFYICALCAVLTCYARVFVGVHYPSDIVGGCLLGFLIAALFLSLVQQVVLSLYSYGRS